jgi:hypothetical protein
MNLRLVASQIEMDLAEQRENGRRCYELAITIQRWYLLRGMYSEARHARRGQRRCWLALRSHVAMMLREGW